MIHRIRVQNFKSIIDVTVDLSPVTVLVGKSGTGKSNFVQALRFLRDILRSQEQLRLNLEKWSEIQPAMNSNEEFIRFEIEFSIQGIDERYQYELSLAGRQMMPAEERLALGDKCLFHQITDVNSRQVRQWKIEPNLVKIPEAGPIALGRIPSISEIVIAYAALTTGVGCYIFSDHVFRESQQQQWSNQQQSGTGLDDAATNYLEALKDIVRNLQDLTIRKSIIGSLQRVNSTVSSVELNDIQQPSHIVVGHKFNGRTLDLRLAQESDGFRRFYAHLLALYQRPPKQTLLFEHPEDGIHPGALSLLADEFKAAPEQGRGQVILTTHSPKLLDHFDAEQIRVVELDGFQTRIGHISDEQKEALHDNLLEPGELLTVDPARMQPEATGA